VGVLVLGVGNVLMRDEALGVRAVEEMGRRFRFPEDVELLDGGTSGIELLSYIRDKDYLIVVDAVKGGNPPGTVVRIEGEDVPAKFMTRISPHQLGISDLLATATISGHLPGKIVLFGIEPKTVELGLGLSDEVKASLERLIEVVLKELRELGYTAEIIPGEVPGSGSRWEARDR
jgi:hydrogenase maturation protease